MPFTRVDRAAAPAAPSGAAADRHAVGIVVGIAVAGLTACAGPVHPPPPPGAAPVVFVASGRGGAVYRLDPVTGAALGPPLPVPGSPQQLAPAPGGGVLVLSMTLGAAAPACRLSRLAAPGAAARAWAAYPLPLPPAPCTQVLLAGAGRRYAVVAVPAERDPAAALGDDAPLSSPPGRLLVFDLVAPAPAGRPAVREVSPWPRGAAVTAVAAADGPDGAVVYVGLWGRAAPAAAAGRGAVLAVDPATGAVLGRAESAGAPERLVLAPAPGGAGRRLYAVEGTPGPDERYSGTVGEPPARWRVLTLDPVALTVTAAAPLATVGGDAAPPLAAAPDGARLFALGRAGGGRSALQTLDAATGAVGPAIALPGEALGGLLATDARVYVPDALGHGVWVVDHRRGHLLGAVDVGRGPVAITSSHLPMVRGRRRPTAGRPGGPGAAGPRRRPRPAPGSGRRAAPGRMVPAVAGDARLPRVRA